VSDESKIAIYHTVKAMRRVTEHLSVQAYNVSVEEAFRLTIMEMEAAYLNLDPEPIEFLESFGVRTAGDRVPYSNKDFYREGRAAFRPRVWYNQDESDYQEWRNQNV